jgi:putative toxin-antitoxin system antitoxin component (TIGR02293 family)
VTIDGVMKKTKKPTRAKKNYDTTHEASVVNEPVLSYTPVKKLPQQKEYSYKKFDSLSAKIPFTLKEWASVLHLSDRTLQRYAKENKPFEGIYADRLLQIEKVINEAAKVFKKPVNFYEWLNEKHIVFGYELSIECFQTQDGIQMLLDELGRMQQGVYV